MRISPQEGLALRVRVLGSRVKCLGVRSWGSHAFGFPSVVAKGGGRIYSRPQVDRIWLWAYCYNRIPI